MKIKNFNILLLIYIIAASFNFMNLKLFESWGQVDKLWASEVSPFEILFHPHMPRYLIVYPGLLLEDKFPDIGFSLYISIFFALNIILFRGISLLSTRRAPQAMSYLVFSLFHLYMNGRGVIIWTAWLICVLVCCGVTQNKIGKTKKIGLMLVSCLFATASTGVFVVVFITFAILAFRSMIIDTKRKYVGALIFLLLASPFLYIITDFFIIALSKNIEYYGGGVAGVINMLEHGLGSFLTGVDPVGVLIFGFLASILLVFGYYMVISKKIILLDYLMMVCLAGGMFGYTVLTLLIPVAILRAQRILGFIELKTNGPKLSV